jgi:ADP-ribose pyrophosphatase YjhB (NUDIX family)
MPDDFKGNSKADAKALLLEDYKALSQLLSESEKIGETRVNWFIGVITAVAGGFAALATKREPSMSADVLRNTALGCLVALLLFGVMTLLRIINRNRTTDGFKKDLARIRRVFRDRLDKEGILDGYHPFKKSSRRRSLGGLADMVAGINSLLAGGLVAVILHFSPSIRTTSAVIVSILAVIGAFAAQDVLLLRNYPWITHGGGVVYRGKKSKAEFLLVGPKKEQPGEWVLPKGHQEWHERIRDTARREVAEETGATTRVVRALKNEKFKVDAETVRVRFYLMELISDGEPGERKPRHRKWFSFEKVVDSATHKETKDVLEVAKARVMRK